MVKTDVKNIDDGYEVDVDLPDLKKEEIHLEPNNGYLTISTVKSPKKDYELTGRFEFALQECQTIRVPQICHPTLVQDDDGVMIEIRMLKQLERCRTDIYKISLIIMCRHVANAQDAQRSIERAQRHVFIPYAFVICRIGITLIEYMIDQHVFKSNIPIRQNAFQTGSGIFISTIGTCNASVRYEAKTLCGFFNKREKVCAEPTHQKQRILLQRKCRKQIEVFFRFEVRKRLLHREKRLIVSEMQCKRCASKTLQTYEEGKSSVLQDSDPFALYLPVCVCVPIAFGSRRQRKVKGQLALYHSDGFTAFKHGFQYAFAAARTAAFINKCCADATRIVSAGGGEHPFPTFCLQAAQAVLSLQRTIAQPIVADFGIALRIGMANQMQRGIQLLAKGF